MYHSLTSVDVDNRVADCAVCGSTKIISKGKNRWQCAIHRKLSRKPDMRRNRTNKQLVYGLTVAERNAFLLGKTCEVCGSADNLVVDHSHVTRKVRGVLCSSHNTVLGRLGDGEDVTLIYALLDYVLKYSGGSK